MIAVLCLACLPQTFLQSAVERVSTGDLAGAWSVAREAPDPLERAQARVYVRLHAGDLPGSLREAVQGSALAPHDPWLAERTLAIALSLSRARPAQEALRRLDLLLQDPNVPNREAYLGVVSRARADVHRLTTTESEHEKALGRARFVVLAVGAAALGLLVVSARKS